MDNLSLETSDRIIREAECKKITTLCRMQRYNLEKKGAFPARRHLGGNAIGWLLSEVTEWMKNRPAIK